MSQPSSTTPINPIAMKTSVSLSSIPIMPSPQSSKPLVDLQSSASSSWSEDLSDSIMTFPPRMSSSSPKVLATHKKELMSSVPRLHYPRVRQVSLNSFDGTTLTASASGGSNHERPTQPKQHNRARSMFDDMLY